MSTHCPHTGRQCPTPGRCAEPAGCVQRKPLELAPFPWPLRRDAAPRAVYPQGVPT